MTCEFSPKWPKNPLLSWSKSHSLLSAADMHLCAALSNHRKSVFKARSRLHWRLRVHILLMNTAPTTSWLAQAFDKAGSNCPACFVLRKVSASFGLTFTMRSNFLPRKKSWLRQHIK